MYQHQGFIRWIVICLVIVSNLVGAVYWQHSSEFSSLYIAPVDVARAGHVCVSNNASYGSIICFGGFKILSNQTLLLPVNYTTTTTTITSTTTTTTPSGTMNFTTSMATSLSQSLVVSSSVNSNSTASTTTSFSTSVLAQTSTISSIASFQQQYISVNASYTTICENSLLFFNARNKSWSVVEGDIVNSPSRRFFHVMTLHSSGRYALLHGGVNSLPNSTFVQYNNSRAVSQNLTVLNDLWLLDIRTLQWKQLSSPDLPALYLHSMVHDSQKDHFIINGGVNINGTVMDTMYRIRINITEDNTYTLVEFVQLSNAPFFAASHSTVFYHNIISNQTFFITFGGVSTYPSYDAGESTTTLRIMSCNYNVTDIMYSTSCSWLGLPGGRGIRNRFGHSALMNPVSGEMYVSGGVVGVQATANVSMLAILSDNPQNWEWKDVPSRKIDRGNPTLYHALAWTQYDQDNVYQVRFGGMDQIYPIVQESQFVSMKSSVEFAYFFYGQPLTLPPYVPPVILIEPPFTSTNTTLPPQNGTTNGSLSNSNNTIYNPGANFSTAEQQYNGIVAGSLVGGVFVVTFLILFIYVRCVNPRAAKDYSFLKFLAADEPLIIPDNDKDQ
ncbi:hypothetical protein MP228_004803 [Amoeboaphelidium protococcarum]|nr:hypothetical protein MP228_004803 [Amoeboaphelidium protococcarum]